MKQIKRLRWFVVFLLPLFGGKTISLHAQNRLDSLQHLQELTVTARRQKLSGEKLRRLNSFSVADAIRYFSGVQLKDYGGVGGLKTVNIRSLGANHVGVFYDGIQLGNAQNGQIDLGKFSLDNMEDLLVQRAKKRNLPVGQRFREFGCRVSAQPPAAIFCK